MPNTAIAPEHAPSPASCAVCEVNARHSDWPWCAACHDSTVNRWAWAAGAGAVLAVGHGLATHAPPVHTGMTALLFAFLAVLALIDWRTMLLPDKLTLPLLWLGLAFNLFGGFVPIQAAVLGAMGGYLTLWTLYWTVALTTGNASIGYGDFKLLAALGAWLGYAPLINIQGVAAGAAVLYVLYLKLRGNEKFSAHLPFGPWLALGGAATVFMR